MGAKKLEKEAKKKFGQACTENGNILLLLMQNNNIV